MASTILNGSYRTEKCELPLLTNQMTALYSWSFTVDCAIVKRWWPILEQSFKFAGVLWLLEWSSCEKLCLVGKINQYASEWQQGCLNVWFFNIFFKPETEVVVAWIFLSLHPRCVTLCSLASCIVSDNAIVTCIITYLIWVNQSSYYAHCLHLIHDCQAKSCSVFVLTC
jgi:hypothetical protein